MTAFDTVAQCAVGAAVQEIRLRGATNEGRSVLAELHRMVAARPPSELPGLRALLDLPPIRTAPDFDEHLTTVLVGLAVRRGDDWKPVAERATHRATTSADAAAGPGRPDSLTA
jgi:hypothetical protein